MIHLRKSQTVSVTSILSIIQAVRLTQCDGSLSPHNTLRGSVRSTADNGGSVITALENQCDHQQTAIRGNDNRHMGAEPVMKR